MINRTRPRSTAQPVVLTDSNQQMEVLTIANNAASELAKKRQKIAKYELEDLRAFNLGRLRELAFGLVPGSSKMKKTNLVEELIAATKTERKI